MIARDQMDNCMAKRTSRFIFAGPCIQVSCYSAHAMRGFCEMLTFVFHPANNVTPQTKRSCSSVGHNYEFLLFWGQSKVSMVALFPIRGIESIAAKFPLQRRKAYHARGGMCLDKPSGCLCGYRRTTAKTTTGSSTSLPFRLGSSSAMETNGYCTHPCGKL